MTLADLADDATLDAAFAWLCARRADWPDHADVWTLRVRWPVEKRRVQTELRTGTYRCAPLQRVTTADGTCAHLWAARDALVLKALATRLADVLPVSPRCVHVRGHGGAKAAVRAAWHAQSAHRFVLKTDVQAYYDLHALDTAFDRPDLFYVRYMDDVLVFAPTHGTFSGVRTSAWVCLVFVSLDVIRSRQAQHP